MRARFVWFLFVVFALAFPAQAEDRRGGLDRILPQVSRTVPGTFYDAEGPFMTPDGRATYRIKWMTPDGRIVWLTVDAQSGQVMGGIPSGPPAKRFNDGGSYDGGDHRNNWRDGGFGDRDGDRGGWNRGNDNRGGWNGRGGNWNQGGRGNDRDGDHGDHDRRHGG